MWHEEYNPNAHKLEPHPSLPENKAEPEPDLKIIFGRTHPKHPGIIPLSSGKFKAYKNIGGERVYYGTYDTLEQAINAQSVLNGRPSFSRKRQTASLEDHIEAFLDKHGDEQ